MKFYRIPQGFIKNNEVLGFDVYIRVSEQKVVKIFEKGGEMNQFDLDRINSYPQNSILFNEDGHLLYLISASKNMVDDSGKIDESRAKELAQTVLNVDDSLSSQEQLETIVSSSSCVVKDILNKDKSIDGEKLLSLVKNLNNEKNVLLAHAHQVCMISMMIGLTQKNLVLEFLNDIGICAMFHGAGLFALVYPDQNSVFDKYINRVNAPFVGQTDKKTLEEVIDKHLQGHLGLSVSEEVIFLKHLTLIEKCFDPKKYKVSPGLKKIIADYKLIQSQGEEKSAINPHVGAKILIIADRIVGLLGNKTMGLSFKSAIKYLQNQNKKSDNKLYLDETVLASLDELVV